MISTHVGLADFVAEHNAGWVFDLNAVALKNAIELAFSQKEKIAHIRKTGRQLVDAHFGENVLIHHYVDMYANL